VQIFRPFQIALLGGFFAKCTFSARYLLPAYLSPCRMAVVVAKGCPMFHGREEELTRLTGPWRKASREVRKVREGAEHGKPLNPLRGH
jgi:hypothetical protein